MSQEKKTVQIKATLLVDGSNNWIIFGSSMTQRHEFMDVFDDTEVWVESSSDNEYQVVMEVPAHHIKQLRVKSKFRSEGGD